jgi:hypothetical protein
VLLTPLVFAAWEDRAAALRRFGPSKYDIAVVYESLAIAQLENAQGCWGNLRVEYARITLWSDHPVALLQPEWVTPAQAAAARTFITHGLHADVPPVAAPPPAPVVRNLLTLWTRLQQAR